MGRVLQTRDAPNARPSTLARSFLRNEDTAALWAYHMLGVGSSNLAWWNLVIAVRAGRLE
jgi:hypothetical protein